MHATDCARCGIDWRRIIKVRQGRIDDPAAQERTQSSYDSGGKGKHRGPWYYEFRHEKSLVDRPVHTGKGAQAPDPLETKPWRVEGITDDKVEAAEPTLDKLVAVRNAMREAYGEDSNEAKQAEDAVDQAKERIRDSKPTHVQIHGLASQLRTAECARDRAQCKLDVAEMGLLNAAEIFELARTKLQKETGKYDRIKGEQRKLATRTFTDEEMQATLQGEAKPLDIAKIFGVDTTILSTAIDQETASLLAQFEQLGASLQEKCRKG